MDYFKESLKKHYEWKGKIEVRAKVDVHSKENLSLAYTPGVAQPCLEIQKNKDLSFDLTDRGNFVAVITDGTAILGLGNIGPEAGMPVMEGKCALFKAFGNVDALPICLRTQDTQEIIRTIEIIAGSFGGINLEDISAPRCFEIERVLKERLDIPVFHDDQHGTSIVVAAALINALKVVGKNMEDLKVVINGAGAAGIAIAKYLDKFHVKNIILVDAKGILAPGEEWMNNSQRECLGWSNKDAIHGTVKDALINADVFIGVSVGNIIKKEMIASMNKGAIVFPLANPIPEISREDALAAGAAVVGTGTSQNPNQINNVMVFPGIFRGALDCRAKDINTTMMIAASKAIASSVAPEQLNANYILPMAYDQVVHDKVAAEVKKAAIASGVNRI